jgi:outer membrane protein OmpA-like peptidoglycan-associated protein
MNKPNGFRLTYSQRRVLTGLKRNGPVIGFCEVARSAEGRGMDDQPDVTLLKEYFDATKSLADAGHVRISPTRSSMKIQLMPSGEQLLAALQPPKSRLPTPRLFHASILGIVATAAGCSFLSNGSSTPTTYLPQTPPAVQAAQFHRVNGEGNDWSYCDSDCPKPTPKTIRLETPVEPPVAAVPSIPKPKQLKQPEKFSLSADVLFDFDKAVVSNQGKTMIDSLSDRLKGKGQLSIDVIGYSDRLGTDAYNLKLSRRRADVVKDRLGITLDPDSISSSGLGKANPVTDGQCDKKMAQAKLVQCLQPDRRVEVHVTRAN